MFSLCGVIKRGRPFKAIAAALCLMALLGGLTGCGKKGPPVAPPQTQSEKSVPDYILRIRSAAFIC